MTHKIDGLPSAALRAADAATRAVRAGGERAEAIAPSAGGDSLRLTGEATGLLALQREMSDTPTMDTQRIGALRSELQAGTYRIDPQLIADRMISLERELR